MASGVIDRMETTFQLLWTNSSPTSSSGFSAQTISLDLTDYDAVMISFLATNNLDRQATVICPKISDNSIVLMTAVPSTTAPRTRNAWATSSGVEFGTAYSGSSSSATSAIPYKIYGIKGLALTK